RRELGRERENRRAVMPRRHAGADQHHRIFGAFQYIGEGVLAGGEFAERVGACTEMIVGVGEIGLGTDQTDFELAATPAFADARVEYGSLMPRIRVYDQKRV